MNEDEEEMEKEERVARLQVLSKKESKLEDIDCNRLQNNRKICILKTRHQILAPRLN